LDFFAAISPLPHFWQVIPVVSLALIAGHFTDRLEKRGLLLKCIVGFLTVSFGLFLAIPLHEPP